MRPLGPSMSAGLSLISVNELKMKSVSETSGIVTSGYGPRKIIIHFFGVRRQSAAATALWIILNNQIVRHDPKRRRRCALPAHSKERTLYTILLTLSQQSCIVRGVDSFKVSLFRFLGAVEG